MKNMTNAEVAAYFAALPADEPAGIIVADLDMASAQEESIVRFGEVKDQIDRSCSPQSADPSMPTVWQKW